MIPQDRLISFRENKVTTRDTNVNCRARQEFTDLDTAFCDASLNFWDERVVRNTSVATVKLQRNSGGSSTLINLLNSLLMNRRFRAFFYCGEYAVSSCKLIGKRYVES